MKSIVEIDKCIHECLERPLNNIHKRHWSVGLQVAQQNLCSRDAFSDTFEVDYKGRLKIMRPLDKNTATSPSEPQGKFSREN